MKRQQGLKKLYFLAVAALLGWAISDLSILLIRPSLTPSPPTDQRATRAAATPPVANLSQVTTRNMFSWEGIMPEPLTADGIEPEIEEAEEIPEPSRLPLTLIGTIVLSNPSKSVATIDLRGQNRVLSYSPEQNIEDMARMVRVERNRAIFRNLNNGRLEFIEIADENRLSFRGQAPTAPSADREVIQESPNNFSIQRADLDRHLSNLPSILQQATAVPFRDPNTGEVGGFRLVNFQPGSVYEQLGLQRMDIIREVNGEPVNSVQRAMELYNAFKTTDSVSLTVERNGRSETLNYSVR